MNAQLLAQLEDEASQGWPAPWWPQDDPRVRTQRLPERFCCGHDLAENVEWVRHLARRGHVTTNCRACNRAMPRSERIFRQRLKEAA